jgi:hypothetical protein
MCTSRWLQEAASCSGGVPNAEGIALVTAEKSLYCTSPPIVTSYLGSATYYPKFSENTVAAHITGWLAVASRQEDAKSLEEQINRCATQLAEMDRVKAALDNDARCRAHRAIQTVFALLVAQFGVLFYWVFVIFDWNLVEPVTYFLGYTGTWLSVVFYGRTGMEFTYDAAREWVRLRMAKRLYARGGFDTARYAALQATLKRLWKERRKLL